MSDQDDWRRWNYCKAHVFIIDEEGGWDKWEITVPEGSIIFSGCTDEIILLTSKYSSSIWDRRRRKLLMNHQLHSLVSAAVCDSTVVFLDIEKQLEVIHFKNMTRWSHSEVNYSSSFPIPTTFLSLRNFHYPYMIAEAGSWSERSLVVLKLNNDVGEVTEVTRLRDSDHAVAHDFIFPHLIYNEEFDNPRVNCIKVYDVIKKKIIFTEELEEQISEYFEYFNGKLVFEVLRCSDQTRRRFLKVYDLLDDQKGEGSGSPISQFREIEIELFPSQKRFFNKTSTVAVNVYSWGLEFKEIDFWRIE